MASMLQVNSIITTLSLADTDLTTDCIIALSTILRANQSITSIDLSNPLLHSHQEDTTCHIAQMLEINKCLKELKLQKHGMTDYGAEMLCRFLKRNHALTKLDISWYVLPMCHYLYIPYFQQQVVKGRSRIHSRLVKSQPSSSRT